jgi:hypothetical protein
MLNFKRISEFSHYAGVGILCFVLLPWSICFILFAGKVRTAL